MIGWLTGEVIDKREPGRIVLNVAGVGYDVEVALPTFFEVESAKEAVSLFIHTQVREDAITLYGFLTVDSRHLFRTLIRVNGVGPKLAMAILSSIQPEAFMQCIREGNATMLTKLPGIGKKTAERLMVEMKDKLPEGDASMPASSSFNTARSHVEEAISALTALGYKPHEASRMVKSLDDGNKSCEALIKESLQGLASLA